MPSDIARAAAVQQTLNSPGYSEIERIGDTMIAYLKDALVNADEDFVGAQREARGAIKFWNRYKAVVSAAANTQIEAETETSLIV